MAADASRPVEVGGDGDGRGPARRWFGAAHDDGAALDGEGGGGGCVLGLWGRIVRGREAAGGGREGCFLSWGKGNGSPGGGFVEYWLCLIPFPRVAARLAPAPRVLRTRAAARVAHHRDSGGRVAVGGIGGVAQAVLSLRLDTVYS